MRRRVEDYNALFVKAEEMLAAYHRKHDLPWNNGNDPRFYLWPQTWGSTSCGFGGLGGSAMTTGTTLVAMTHSGAVVFHCGRFAYIVHRPSQHFYDAMKRWRLPGQADNNLGELSEDGRVDLEIGPEGDGD